MPLQLPYFRREVAYDAKGTNTWNNRTLAIMVYCTWPNFKEMVRNLGNDTALLPEDEDALVKHLQSHKFEDPVINALLHNGGLYDVSHPVSMKRVKTLMWLEEGLVRRQPLGQVSTTIFNCTDYQVGNVLIERYTGKAIATIRSAISTVRQSLMSVGRRHAFGDGQPITNPWKEEAVIAHSGNPVTAGILKSLRDVAMVMPDKECGEAGSAHKGPRARFAVIALIIERQMLELARMAIRLENKRDSGATVSVLEWNQLDNMARFALFLVTLAHTGARPGNITSDLQHKNLCLNLLHERDVPALLLVMLEPETLAELLKGDRIKSYSLETYTGNKNKANHKATGGGSGNKNGEGGQVAGLRLRVLKSTVPGSCNVLDLVNIYTVSMKILAHFDRIYEPAKLRPEIFKDMTFNSQMTSVRKALGIEGLVPYSIRYAASGDDKASKIDPQWIRVRMGHAPNSMTWDSRYAKNTTVATFVETEYDAVQFEGEEPVENDDDGDGDGEGNVFLASWVPCGTSQTCKGFLDGLSAAMKQEINDKIKIAKTLVNKASLQPGDMVAFNAVMTGLKEKNGKIGDLLKELYIGTSYDVKEQQMPERLHDVMRQNRVDLAEIFKSLVLDDDDDDMTPLICTFTQLIYHDWRTHGQAVAITLSGGVKKRERVESAGTKVLKPKPKQQKPKQQVPAPPKPKVAAAVAAAVVVRVDRQVEVPVSRWVGYVVTAEARKLGERMPSTGKYRGVISSVGARNVAVTLFSCHEIGSPDGGPIWDQTFNVTKAEAAQFLVAECDEMDVDTYRKVILK